MASWNPDKYLKAWNYASRAHRGQMVPGSDIPYINHVGSVTMEALAAIAQGDDVEQPDLLVQCALLHDVIEDTDRTFDELRAEFGTQIADGVSALSKDPGLATKQEQMLDSLERIKSQPREVWMVKLADRITNLQPPPHHWSKEKIRGYSREGGLILDSLGAANRYLSRRLAQKLAEYSRHIK